MLAAELHRAGGDYREAFRNYEQLLRPFIARKQRSAQTFAAAFAPRTRPEVWARNHLSRLLSLPYIGDWIIRAQLRDHFELPDYRM